MWQFVPPTLAAAFLGSLYYFFRSHRRAIRPPPGASLDRQAIEIEGEPGVYKCGYLTDGEKTVTYMFPDVRTLYDVFLRGLHTSANAPCLGERSAGSGPYVYQTYSEVFQKGRDFGAALVGQLGLQPGNSTNIGIYSKNCSQWFISALGAITQSIVVIPLYDTLGADAANFIVQQAEIEVIVVDNLHKATKLITSKCLLPSLKHIVVIDESSITKDIHEQAAEAGVEVHRYSEILKEGRAHPTQMLLPSTDDTYIICYTSGTTGVPKGVILTHKNLVANLSSFAFGIDKFLPNSFTADDVLISYLPLSHMIEQMSHWAMMMYGASIGYFRGDIKFLTDDIKAVRPTIFPVVPRILNRFYDAIQSKLSKSSPIARAIYNLAYSRKLADLKKGIVRRDTIWDKLVFNKIQEQVGGRVNMMATGSAPINAKVLETLRIALGTVIVEAYGQTECTALAACTWPGDASAGHTGGPSPCANIKLVDVPDLTYYAKDRKGEILVRGPSVTKGYFKDPEKTAELFDEDGFLRTGDIGQLGENGTIRIIDRKKHIFKLAQGEYVAPEKIENVYSRCGVLQQVYVDGDSLERWLIAVVVPEHKPLIDWDRSRGNKRTIEEICKDPEVEAFVLAELHKIGKENKLNSIEQVKKVILELELFSIENGLLTPTLKAKRPQLRQKYKEAMSQIYAQHPDL